jgi:hypothetical protein
MSKKQIILKFGIGDIQLLQLWASFMLHNDWIQKEAKWHVKEKVRTRANKFHL